jgi:hypothetical protein
MNKHGYQPLPVLLRAEPDDARSTSNVAKILCVVATLGTVLTLCGAVSICLIAFNAFPPRKLESKASVVAPLPATNASPAADAVHDNDANLLPTDTNQSHRGTIADDHTIIEPMPTPALIPTSTPVPTPQPEASVSDNELLKEAPPDTGRINLDRQLPEPQRKTLEKERRQAERKRSRLEEMYRKHAVSSEAYKKGEEKYRNQIERYRREMNADRGPKNEVAGQN